MKESKLFNLYLHISGTVQHKLWVLYYILQFCYRLIKRAIIHDISKFSITESKGFINTIRQLKGSTYGSEEYKYLLTILKPSLDHHYLMNSHHPEYHHMIISNMNLLDIVELFQDWRAAVRRHTNGDIIKSIANNEVRFGIPKEMSSIFRNSI